MKNNIMINGEIVKPVLYDKPVLSAEQHIKLLKSRWLIFRNEEEAKLQLQRNAYYRLSWYMRYFYKDPAQNFKEWTDFKDITELYYFDGDLKLLLLDVLEVIEVDFKTQIINIMSEKYWTPFWFMDEEKFISIWSYKNITEIIQETVNRNKDNSSPIKHYYNKYAWPALPPIWMIMQILSFWGAGILYTSLLIIDKVLVAKRYNLRWQQLQSRIDCMAYLRNLCAHSDRVWNRKMTKKLRIKWMEGILLSNDTTYSYILVVVCLLRKISDNFSRIWEWKLVNFIKSHKSIQLNSMWFPKDWEEKMKLCSL